MRAGICSIQLQALTPEAATLVKQAVNLATRRGHAQVTPLHVASAMIATSTGILRRACLQCHYSHPLQYKALELCFNVSLNRLPAASTSSSTLLDPRQYSSTPSLSNALVAAFKRAQTHQRRGSTENQQNPILALKIEVEQLIVSILDDPTVSRVMREAGFSSTLVKSKVEETVSVEVCSQQPKDSSTKPQTLGGSNNIGGSFMNKTIDHVNNDVDDVTSALSELVRRRRNTVIVGENIANAEGVAKGLMERFERGNVPGELRYVQFVSLPLISFRDISKEEVEKKLLELRRLMKSYVGRGFILYLGDLKWLFEFWSNYCEQRTNNYYCSVEHMVMELKRLISGNGENNGKLWLMGIATFRTYMKCKICHPSLETIWELHPFTIPVGSLNLSLNLNSGFQAQERSKVKDEYFEDRAKVLKHLTCCRDCSLNFEKEADNIASSINKKECTTSLPTWIQNCKEERSDIMDDQQEKSRLVDICKKWNSFCRLVHGHPSNHEKQLFLASSSPSSPNSVSSHERKPSLHLSHLYLPGISSEPKQVPKEYEFYTETETVSDDCFEGNLIMVMPDHRNVPKPDIFSNPNSSPNSASPSETVDGLDSTLMFKELNADNLKILCDALEKKVPPQHKEIVKEIASTVLLCRSGKRKGDNNHLLKRINNQETWMFFLGVDSQAKEITSKELAKVVFGSYSNFVSIGMSSFSSPKADDSTGDEESKNKRPRNEYGSSYLQRFGEAVNEDPHRVFFMEDWEQVDHFSQKGIMHAIENGNITLPGGEYVPLKDAIVIFSCEGFSSVSRAKTSPSAENEGDITNLEEKSSCLSLDLNIAIEVDTKNVQLPGDSGILELVDKYINFDILVEEK